MVWSCRSCNSSKRSNDVLEWLSLRNQFPPLLLLRRYLKLAVKTCRDRDVMSAPLDNPELATLPFSLPAVPHKYPAPSELALWVVPLG